MRAADGGCIPAGSLLIFNHKTWHRGTPAGNVTGTPRDIVTNAYSRPDCVQWKPQLLQPGAGEGARPFYEEPGGLLREAGRWWGKSEAEVLRQLLRRRGEAGGNF